MKFISQLFFLIIFSSGGEVNVAQAKQPKQFNGF